MMNTHRRALLLAAPALPAPIAARMAAATEQAMREPAIRERLQRTGSDLGMMGPMEFTTFLRAEDEKWASAARDGLLQRAQ